jgi:hypothetical protein
MNECLCPVIKNSATPREQTSLLCYIQLKVHWNIYNAKTMGDIDLSFGIRVYNHKLQINYEIRSV